MVRPRYARRIAVLALSAAAALGATLTLATPAFGAYHQRGYEHSSAVEGQIEGVRASVTTSPITIPSGDCLLFDVVMQGYIQVETGSLKCGSGGLDGNCGDDGNLTAYSEKYVPGVGGTCHEYGTISANTYHTYTAREKNGDPQTLYGLVDGDVIVSVGGFTQSSSSGRVWGELTGDQQSCDFHYDGDAAFTAISRYE